MVSVQKQSGFEKGCLDRVLSFNILLRDSLQSGFSQGKRPELASLACLPTKPHLRVRLRGLPRPRVTVWHTEG